MNEYINLVKSYFDKYRSFVLYMTIGFSGLALDMLSFWIMINFLKVPVLVANPISMSVGIVNNFFLNAYLNFKKTDNILFRLGKFYLVGIFGIIFSDIWMWGFHEKLLFPVMYVKAVSIVVVAIMQYFLNRKFSFNK